MSELLVSVDLLKRGYEVFRSLSPNCSCDLAILKDGTLRRIEVRTGYNQPLGKNSKKLVYGKKNIGRADIVAVYARDEDKIYYFPELQQPTYH